MSNKPKFRRIEKGNQKGEDVYRALGQTDAGRYIAVLFIHKRTNRAWILSARDMARMRENTMAKSKPKRVPSFRSLDDLVKFFDTHDTGEYWEHLPEAHFDVNIKRRKHLIAIDAEISGKLTEIAQSKKTSSQKLVNSWLKEKLRKVS